MKLELKVIVATTIFLVSSNALSVNGWSGPHKVQMIDTLDVAQGYKSYITLEGFVNPGCNENRILLQSSDPDHYKEMSALILAAFHAGTKVDIYLSSSCGGQRVRATRQAQHTNLASHQHVGAGPPFWRFALTLRLQMAALH
ncbi:hypothetical protein FKG94_20265 [Exilibacterium tricleocarpae]|uniref:Uncharacterized protein n=1 Tax=Exilibacterium tricleocarpae TaxID=2591008 RepID=A0A545T0G6_9GAMM|nr:hypothetical protein [Exilibacterium tricleocarpae]TQV70669.1 hypothetical protein FKG94_20265 [Exilibacterium tricleocarpae]